jgi:hypothetical protein
MATEEFLLQLPAGKTPALSRILDEPSAAPFVEVRGVRVHSGDLLVSRGGAPTSAFISRGSDYPGNFSHVALVYIDSTTKKVSVVESHIESGVGLSSVEDYFTDKKLRLIVLRLRSDLPAVEKDPLLAHRAATFAYREATSRHIPYDFSMNVADSSQQFCSEVASGAFRHEGIHLWERPSRFSSPGLARWMAALGVRHLSTHGPSDLEYDPKLRVVAEWHDPEALFLDHVDNAVTDALLERAEAGAEFEYSRALLPIVRTLKGYSLILNSWGAVGPVPEGMSATVALRARWLTQVHELAREGVVARSEEFENEHGYRPPYFRLIEFAEASLPAW